jgi:hypothetical protein
MRKVLSIIFSIIIIITSFIPVTALASDNDLESNYQNQYDLTIIENDKFESIGGVSLCSSNLILRNNI